MTFADLALGDRLFIDSNTLVYHFAADPVFGPACAGLMSRIQKQELQAFTSTHALSEAAHRTMTIEAAALFGWKSKLLQRLKQQPAKVQQLSKLRQAVEQTPQLGIQILTVASPLIAVGAAISQQTGLLTNDALMVAVMQDNGLTKLASADADLDGAPGITRYAPA
jgi:predicted nucleic acid-binding protein